MDAENISFLYLHNSRAFFLQLVYIDGKYVILLGGFKYYHSQPRIYSEICAYLSCRMKVSDPIQCVDLGLGLWAP